MNGGRARCSGRHRGGLRHPALRLLPAAGTAFSLAALVWGPVSASHAKHPAAQRREEARIAAVLARMPVYPGARPAMTAGFPLAGPAVLPATNDLVKVHALWTAPTDAMMFSIWAMALTRRLHMAQTGSSGADGSPTALVFSPERNPHRLSVEVSWQALGRHRVAVRYDVLAIWQPPHPAAEVIPRDVGMAAATYAASPGAKPRTLVLGRGRALSRLSRMLNRMPVDTRGVTMCPSEQPGASAVVRFAWRGGELTASEAADGCGFLSVRGPGGAALPSLYDPSGRLLARVRTLVATGLRTGGRAASREWVCPPSGMPQAAWARFPTGAGDTARASG